MHNVTVELDNREAYDNGNVSYDLTVIDKETEEEIASTTLTVDIRQEKSENFDDIVKNTAEGMVEKHRENGVDHSGKKLDI